MATGALAVAKKEASQRIANYKRRMESQGMTETMVHKGTLFTTAGVYGALNRMDVPISIGGFPWKVGVGALSLIAEALTTGNTRAVMSGISDATLAIYIERSISENTLIAGDYDDDDDEDDDGGDI